MKLNNTVTIFGGGSWGTAVAKNIAENGYRINLWVREKEVAKSIEKYSMNKAFLPGIKLPSSISATTTLGGELFKSRILIFSIPTQFIRSSLEFMKPFIRKDSILINTSKGIEQSSMNSIFGIFQEVLPGIKNKYITMSGPSFAYDVANNLPTSVTLASYNQSLVLKVMPIFDNKTFKTYLSKDVIGVELGGSLKNIVSIGAGIVDGIGGSESTKAAFITRGLNEVRNLSRILGAKDITFLGLSGVGDLMLTAHGKQSRNRNLGIKLGKGMRVKEILSSSKTVAEGYYSSKAAYELTKKFKISSPVIESIYKILYKNSRPQNIIKSLSKNDLITDI